MFFKIKKNSSILAWPIGHAIDVHCRNARQLQGMEIDSLVWTNQWSKTRSEGIEIKVCTLENAPAQQLYMEGVNEQEIIRRTSHRSKKAARKFKNLFPWWQNPCKKKARKRHGKWQRLVLSPNKTLRSFGSDINNTKMEVFWELCHSVKCSKASFKKRYSLLNIFKSYKFVFRLWKHCNPLVLTQVFDLQEIIKFLRLTISCYF